MALQHADLLEDTSPFANPSSNSTTLTSKLKDRNSRSASPGKQVTFCEKSPRYFYISTSGKGKDWTTKDPSLRSKSANPDGDFTSRYSSARIESFSQKKPWSNSESRNDKSPTLQYINDKLNKLEKQIDGFKQMQKKRAEFWRQQDEDLHSTEQLEEIFSHAKSRLYNSSSSTSCKNVAKHPLKLKADSVNRRSVKPKTSTGDSHFLGAQMLNREIPKYRSYNSYQRESNISEKDDKLEFSCYDSYKSKNAMNWRPSSVERSRLQKDFRSIKSRDSMRELENLNGDIRAKIHELRKIMQTTSPRTHETLQHSIII